LVALNFIGNYDELNTGVCRRTVDQFHQTNVCSLPDVDHCVSPTRPTTELKDESSLTNTRMPADMQMINGSCCEIELRSSILELKLLPRRLLPWDLVLGGVRPIVESPKSFWAPGPISRYRWMPVTPGGESLASYNFDLIGGNTSPACVLDQCRQSISFTPQTVRGTAGNHNKTTTV
jgi:hypothetical protein